MDEAKLADPQHASRTKKVQNGAGCDPSRPMSDAEQNITGRMLDEDAHTVGVEMIRNKMILTVFRLSIKRPLTVIMFWSILSASCWAFATPYKQLQRRKLDLAPFNNQLKHVQETLWHDFETAPSMVNMVGENEASAMYDAIVVWCESACNLREDPLFKKASSAVDSVLTGLKKTGGNCNEMSWMYYNHLFPPRIASVLMANDTSAAVVLVSKPCTRSIKSSLVKLDREFGGLRVALGTPSALVLASIDETSERAMRDMAIAVPITFILLWVNTGNFLRATTPFICLACAISATKAATVILKLFVANLNYSGPDTPVLFIQLALCLDYGLFFWTRFAQERQRRPDPMFYEDCIMKTLQTTGAVIFVSMAVLVIAFAGMCFYPDQNTVGCLAGNIQLIVGVVMLGNYCLIIPASLAAWRPSWYDEKKTAEGDSGIFSRQCLRFERFMQLISQSLRTMYTKFSYFITSPPWMIVLPIVVYACFVPFIVELGHFKPNFDMFTAATSKTVTEYEAFTHLKSKFNLGRMDPIHILLEARPMDYKVLNLAPRSRSGNVMAPEQPPEASNLLAESSDASGKVALMPQFRKLACSYVEAVLKGTHGKPYQIGAGEVENSWWNSTSGHCATSEMPQELGHLGPASLTSAHGQTQLLKLYPPFESTSPEMQALTRFLWSQMESQPWGHFEIGKNMYEFKATHYTPLGTLMLMERLYAARAPYILTTLVVVICIIVGLLFSSVGLGVKLVITVILPIAAEFGLAVGAYQHGWLEWAGIPRSGGLIWSTAYTGMGLIFGLAIDYDIFLFARVYERRMEGYDNISAVRMAIVETSSIITVAGTMMCISFLFVAGSGIDIMAQVGFLYFVGVALDTYVVRYFLAPAVLCLSERMNYWPGHVPKATKSWDGDLSKLD